MNYFLLYVGFCLLELEQVWHNCGSVQVPCLAYYLSMLSSLCTAFFVVLFVFSSLQHAVFKPLTAVASSCPGLMAEYYPFAEGLVQRYEVAQAKGNDLLMR